MIKLVEDLKSGTPKGQSKDITPQNAYKTGR